MLTNKVMPRRNRLVGLAAISILTLVAACGGAAPAQDAPASDQTLEAILATTVLRVGPQRVAFLLTQPNELVTVPEATVTLVREDGGSTRIGAPTQARFYLWPYGVRGSYSTELDFSEAGTWRLDISIPKEGGGTERTQLLLDVAEQTGVVEIGALPPFSASKTLASADRLEELTSASEPDPELYELSIPQALRSGNPTVVVFSTPAFCTSPTCGPQVDVLSELKEAHRDEANFIHVETYDNPADIQGDLSLAEYTPLVHDWGLSTVPHWTNESWAFVLGRDGRVASRFEAFVSREELEEALMAALQ